MSALLRNLVFKVIGIEESGFVEKTNLRVGRINLNFSITDVQWHPVDGKYSLSMQTCLFNRVAHMHRNGGSYSYDTDRSGYHSYLLCTNYNF